MSEIRLANIGVQVWPLMKKYFSKLNKPTNNIGTSPKNIEIIIRNFEDHLIDEDNFMKTLALLIRNLMILAMNLKFLLKI